MLIHTGLGNNLFLCGHRALVTMSDKSWFVYMIRTTDNQLYTGITTDIQRRWHEHLSGKGGARYFRGRTPAALYLVDTQPDRSSASRREYALKQLTKKSKEALVADIAVSCPGLQEQPHE